MAMRIIVGKPPENPEFHPIQEGWTPLREPRNMWLLQLVAIPIGILLAILIGLLAVLLNVFDTLVIDLYDLLALVAIIPVHEFLHAVMFPARLSSDHVMCGFWPKACVFYAHYDGVVTRRRFIGVFLAPFLGISVLPLILLKLFAVHNQAFILTCAFVNAFGSAGDVLGVLLILFQVPRKAKLRNQGFRTYWKAPEAGARRLNASQGSLEGAGSYQVSRARGVPQEGESMH
ncbi:DUF3267 domain-containing protein [Alicyclobacillus macrosporangiidus]|uniref:DUF3267 domain-containing protein n=1 Tax=Alicyclobacillus macrosporangiidus TaxID=392015 RepID=UPI000555E3CC|nr:DUF3267 domain-containing protein [Alicyclobacillus macrosporangiidus]